MPGLTEFFIAARAKRVFSEGVADLAGGIPLSTFEDMASKNARVLDFLPPQLKAKAATIDSGNPGVRYIQSLPVPVLLDLICKAAPAHGAILQRYPVFAKQLAEDIRMLVGGMAR